MYRDLTYPVALERGEEGDVVVTFPDVPEAVTFGYSEAEALVSAVDALRVALRTRQTDGLDIPDPSPVEPGQPAVPAPAEISAKRLVIDAFARAGLSKTELARRMEVQEGEVRRILDPHHRTKLDRLEEAARALGGRLRLEWCEL